MIEASDNYPDTGGHYRVKSCNKDLLAGVRHYDVFAGAFVIFRGIDEHDVTVIEQRR